MDIDKVLDIYKENYCRIFRRIYPSKNSTGFTERNMSVNFAKAYERYYPEAITWYEFQFGAKNNLHYDAIIVNPCKQEIVLIEAKRFSVVYKKIDEVKEDIHRIQAFTEPHFAEFASRIPNLEEYSVIGVVLADVWTESENKIAVKESFEEDTFIQKYLPDVHEKQDLRFEKAHYFCRDFRGIAVSDIKKDNTIPTNYYLLGMIWDVKKSETVI